MTQESLLPYARRHRGWAQQVGWSRGNIGVMVVAILSFVVASPVALIFLANGRSRWEICILSVAAFGLQVPLATVLLVIYTLACRRLETAWHAVLIVAATGAPLLTAAVALLVFGGVR